MLTFGIYIFECNSMCLGVVGECCFLFKSDSYGIIVLIAGVKSSQLIKLLVLCKTNQTTRDICTFSLLET